MTFLVSTNPIVTISGSTPIAATEGPTPIISIQDSTISQKGAVQLEDSITSTSVVKAATPNSVKTVYDHATTISGNLQIDISGKSDIGHDHVESDITDLDKYTQSEVDSLIATVSGGSDNHNELNNLDYASSGHTGFQPAGEYLTDSEFSTYSGTLQSQIDDKSDSTHTHDDRYYRESEVDTISGSLNTAKSDVGHLHTESNISDLDKYTQAEVDSLITTISGKLDDHNELNNLDYASSGHTGFQPSGDYLTDSEFSTYSGTLQSQIDDKSDIDHLHDDRYYSESEVDTISGSLQTDIDTKDNYSNWNFAVDGVTKDAITSDDVLNFVGGENITLTRSAEDEITISGSSGGSGVTDHGSLSGLEDDDHTQYLLRDDFTTYSGGLQSQIDDKSELTHLHDDRYYTESEVDDLITTISGKLDDHNELNNLDYASSGHTGFQPAGDYLTKSEIDTISGSLQTNIDGKSDIGHLHDDRYYTELETDTISGALNIKINSKPDTLLELSDTPGVYDANKYLRSTVDGAEWAAVSGTGGTSIHSELSNLAYADAGHTGFASSVVLSTTSGSLQTEIDGKANTSHSHDDRYYTESEVDALITTISGKLDDHDELNNLDYASSGHTGFQPAGDYLTDSEFSTYSGTLQAEIDTKSDIGHTHNDLYYTESEVDTISGTLNAKIGEGSGTLLGLSDTPDIYEDGEYLRSTTSGVEWTIPEAESVIIRGKEENTSAITKGQVCAIVGSSGVKAEVCLCDCDNADKVRNIGLAQNDIPQNENGIIVYKGILEEVDTRTTNSDINPYGETWTPGTLLWASNIPGGLTKVRPTSGRSIKAARTVKGNNTSDVLIVITHVNSVWATTASDEDIVLRVGDSVGANKVSIRNYNNEEKAAFDSYGNLTTSGTIDGVDVSTLKSDFDGHTHDDRYYSESEVDTISGSLDAKIPDTFIDLSDTPNVYDANKYLRSTVDGTEWATVSGGTGTSIHSDLSNLAYVDSGHTGFASSAELLTTSGSLQVGIDEKSDINHLHDDRYYIESEVDTISGSLNDAKSDIGHTHTESDITDLDKYTQAEIDILITTISGKLDDHNELNNLDYDSSGHTGFQAAGDYLTGDEFSTYSGTLQSQIDTKSDIGHLHNDQYYTESEVDTISGSLQTNIDGKSDTSHLHDDRYYRESEVDTISGSLNAAKSDVGHSHTESDISNLDKYTQSEVDSLITTISGKLDDHNELNNLDYASAGHTGFQPSGDYATDSELTSTSGSLQTNIENTGLAWRVITTNTNAEKGHGYLVNATAGAITVTLPASPSEGEMVGICDIYNKATTHTLSLARNSRRIEGASEDLVIDINGSGFTLVYTDALRGWEIVSEAGRGDNVITEYIYIGIPGTQGFGVGVCANLPAGMSAMSGSSEIASDNYGNYQYSDGSIMCWIPKFYYRINHASNPTYPSYAANSIDIKDSGNFVDTSTANASGYALHRAFIDGGQEQDGFFIDKYLCSNNGGTCGSILNGNPLSSNTSHNPFSGLTGSPANYYYGAIDAAKTRGNNFFCTTKFIYSALAILSLAHAQAATATTYCGWYDATGVKNYPKGNNNYLVDIDDTGVTFTTDGYSNPASSKTGSGTPFNKTTHNGQNNGITDLNGNMWEIALGLVRSGTTSSEAINDSLGTTKFYTLKQSTQAKDLTSGWTSGAGTVGKTAWGDAAYLEGTTSLYDLIDLPMIGKSSGWARFGNVSNQVLDSSTTGAGWLRTGLSIYLDTGSSSGGTNLFGVDGLYEYWRSNCCEVCGGGWSGGANAGIWTGSLNDYRTYSNVSRGLRCALYL